MKLKIVKKVDTQQVEDKAGPDTTIVDMLKKILADEFVRTMLISPALRISAVKTGWT